MTRTIHKLRTLQMMQTLYLLMLAYCAQVIAAERSSAADVAKVMDKSATQEATGFIDNYFSQKAPDGKRKRFPAVFSVYLAGLDHEAHMNGLGGYRNYFINTVDDQINRLITTLFNQGEFDNKIFIIVADHRHTAMPTDLTCEKEMQCDDPSCPMIINVPVDMSCSLKTDMLNQDTRESELNNNSLHIWELGEMFKAVGSIQNAAIRNKYKLLVPSEIEQIFVKESVPLDYRPTSSISDAHIVAALNGPMAHIYSLIGTGNKTLGEIAEAFRVMFGGLYPEAASRWYGFEDLEDYIDFRKLAVGRLGKSIDKILIRLQDGNYRVFNELDNSGNPLTSDISSISEPDFIEALSRISGMNNRDRSGDIVLIMKDKTLGLAKERYSTAYACMSWHGSLNPSDSYVPFVFAYPGGNKSEMEKILQKDTLCKTDYSSCRVNWKLTDIVKEIISQQYK